MEVLTTFNPSHTLRMRNLLSFLLGLKISLFDFLFRLNFFLARLLDLQSRRSHRDWDWEISYQAKDLWRILSTHTHTETRTQRHIVTDRERLIYAVLQRDATRRFHKTRKDDEDDKDDGDEAE